MPENVPTLREYQGAQLWLLRRPGDDLIVFWGISPLSAGERGTVRCFIQDRTDRTIRGETRPFLDACHGAWWSRDGRFLGYEANLTGPAPDGPPLVRVPAEVHSDRIHPDAAFLRCLQNREASCGE